MGGQSFKKKIGENVGDNDYYYLTVIYYLNS